MKNFKLGNVESGISVGLDAFLASNPQIVSPVGNAVKKVSGKRIKVGSLDQLNGFRRIDAETLVHKSTNDLWAIRKDSEDYYIERLFQDGDQPLKG